MLEKCAMTALSSKLISQQKVFFAKMVVDAVMMLDELLQLKMIGIKKVQGGALEVSEPVVASLDTRQLHEADVKADVTALPCCPCSLHLFAYRQDGKVDPGQFGIFFLYVSVRVYRRII